MLRPLSPPKAKTQRAEEHLEDLDGVVKWFLEREPYDLVPEIEPETGDKVYRVRIREHVTHTIPLIAGDVVHNARAALDLIHCALVTANGNVVTDSDVFPISATAHKFNAKATQIRSRVGKDAAEVIKEIEPYKRGDGHALWCLHRLDIVDKHRLLLATPCDITHIVGPRYLSTESGVRAVIRFPEWGAGPIKDGDEVGRITPHPELEGHDKPKFVFDITLYEPTIIETQPIIELLASLLQEANRVIDSLTPFAWFH